MRDYQIVSPSLEGVLNHDSLLYEGVKRPFEVLRILDGPAAKGEKSTIASELNHEKGGVERLNEMQQRELQEYFYDLYSVFMKKLSLFIVGSEIPSDDTIKMQAMLQEMIRIKKWVSGKC